jgi:SAM-dependent methyltransferase
MSQPEYPPLAEQERYWETWHEAKSITEWSQARGEVVLSLLRALQLSEPEILDLGCGTGWFTDRLTEFGKATGTDLSLKAIELAKVRFPRATFVGGDVFEVDLPERHYDVVISQQVIAHVVDQPRYLERAASLLKPGGHLILTTPNKFVMDRLEDLGWEVTPPEHLELWLDRRSLLRLLKPRFRVLRLTSINPMGRRGILRLVNSTRLNRALGLVIPQNRLTSLKERAGLGYTLVVLARRRD